MIIKRNFPWVRCSLSPEFPSFSFGLSERGNGVSGPFSFLPEFWGNQRVNQRREIRVLYHSYLYNIMQLWTDVEGIRGRKEEGERFGPIDSEKMRWRMSPFGSRFDRKEPDQNANLHAMNEMRRTKEEDRREPGRIGRSREERIASILLSPSLWQRMTGRTAWGEDCVFSHLTIRRPSCIQQCDWRWWLRGIWYDNKWSEIPCRQSDLPQMEILLGRPFYQMPFCFITPLLIISYKSVACLHLSVSALLKKKGERERQVIQLANQFTPSSTIRSLSQVIRDILPEWSYCPRNINYIIVVVI